MERLVCGDVGFGKTEVAIRAIYRAVLDGHLRWYTFRVAASLGVVEKSLV